MVNFVLNYLNFKNSDEKDIESDFEYENYFQK